MNLQKLSNLYKKKEELNRNILLEKATKKNWPLILKSNNPNQIIVLTSIDVNGFPMYTATENNYTSANTTRTNQLWAGGSTGFNLSGSSTNVKGKLALWDGGSASNIHIELSGRIKNKDASSTINHSTHVAGTLIAQGINPVAKGMAYETSELNCYDFNGHISEMAAAAPELLMSNHSYGSIAGWSYTFTGEWEFWGNPNDNFDYKFGIYNEEAQLFDSIAYNAPYYLIVKSSGNNRDRIGPPIGSPYKRLDVNGVMVNSGNRPPGISSNDGYDIIPTYGVAKNILTVGAIEGLKSSLIKTSDIKISNFGSWGPTDDGRIKPDIVASGVNVYSCISNSTTSYEAFNGTSMAAPNVTGSLFLLQELYSNKNAGEFMKASTLKALAIHTATESGDDDGPDYKFGWGLLNAEKAANLINAGNNGTSRIIESSLNNNSIYTLNVTASGNGKLIATIVWTDPVGAATTTNLLNNPSLKLINDLDIRIIKGVTTYYPWVLDPANPSFSAYHGDNFRDNVERIDIDDVIPGTNYTIIVSYKNVLQRGSQAFSLIISGVGGAEYCNSFAILNFGARIDNVNFAGINNNNPIGCTQYSNYKNLIAQIEPNTIYPLSVKVSSCDANSNPKFVKVFIDYNSNGSFADAGELVATSGVLNNNAIFSTIIATPNSFAVNNKSLMRVIVQETNDPNTISPCNTYNQGETQDYAVQFINANIDVSISEVEIPTQNACFNNNQFISIRINNVGKSTISNIPLTAIIKNGFNTIATLTGVYSNDLLSGESVVYHFQTPFTSIAGTAYLVFANASLNGDQNPNNNSKNVEILIKNKAIAASGQAIICGTVASLRAFNTNSNQNYLWYNSPTSITPVASGTNTSTNTIASKYYIGAGIATNIGALTKEIFTDGDYQAKGGNYFKYSATVPMLLERAKIYTAYPGKVTITVADIKATFADGSYTYTALNSTILDVLASRPIKATGDIAGNDPQDLGLIYNINLPLPAGNHVIIITSDSVANIFRNKNIAVNPYPYSISSLFSITGNNATNPTQFYYYLYNMALRTLDCLSDMVEVIPTILTVPTITRVGDSLVSINGIGYQWIKNSVEIIGANNQNFKPIYSGNYQCKVTDNLGCQQLSNSIVFDSTKVVIATDLIVKPNPANSFITYSFKSEVIENAQVCIVDSKGVIYFKQDFIAFVGTISKQVSTNFFPSGLYVINILKGGKTYKEKFLILR